MKKLLLITAIFESLTGILLMIAPTLIASLLLGEEPFGAVALTIAKIAGAALFSLAIACWLSQNNAAAAVVVKAMLFYNIAVAAILLYGAIGYKLSGMGLMPAVLLHGGFAVWCIVCLNKARNSK